MFIAGTVGIAAASVASVAANGCRSMTDGSLTERPQWTLRHPRREQGRKMWPLAAHRFSKPASVNPRVRAFSFTACTVASGKPSSAVARTSSVTVNLAAG
jgi:hypothetical protein